ncbi:hypothetical protein [Leptothoe sp. PORK10 BA2]|nr:hypothetical protein [Leptothoe sp. PORK10 BA2]MEA5466849.1 hypothetical protein [Leptothoe sp. PORK10 BA2]
MGDRLMPQVGHGIGTHRGDAIALFSQRYTTHWHELPLATID